MHTRYVLCYGHCVEIGNRIRPCPTDAGTVARPRSCPRVDRVRATKRGEIQIRRSRAALGGTPNNLYTYDDNELALHFHCKRYEVSGRPAPLIMTGEHFDFCAVVVFEITEPFLR